MQYYMYYISHFVCVVESYGTSHGSKQIIHGKVWILFHATGIYAHISGDHDREPMVAARDRETTGQSGVGPRASTTAFRCYGSPFPTSLSWAGRGTRAHEIAEQATLGEQGEEHKDTVQAEQVDCVSACRRVPAGREDEHVREERGV